MKSYKFSPWGQPDEITKVAEGIEFYSTPSHGGYRLSAKRLAEMAESFPTLAAIQPFAGRGWYEEDCDWWIVVAAFPQYFTEKEVATAPKYIEEWHKVVFAY